MTAPDNFFSRWSRRKTAAAQGLSVDTPDPAAMPPGPPVGAAPLPAPPAGPAPLSSAAPPAMPLPADDVAPLTLDDAAALTPESDFKPFVTRDVAPEVRNAAVKKLFADPHFNVMDRMDVYIDDYSLPDPLPESMLRQMASAEFLNLFDDTVMPGAAKTSQQPGANPDTQVPGNVTQSSTADLQPDTTPNAHADLRLQPHHAAVGPDAGQGTERDADPA